MKIRIGFDIELPDAEHTDQQVTDFLKEAIKTPNFFEVIKPITGSFAWTHKKEKND